MLAIIKEASKKAVLRGIEGITDTKEIKRIILVNTICLFRYLFSVPFLVLDLVKQMYQPLTGIVAGVLVNTIIYYLNGQDSSKSKLSARIILIVSSYAYYFLNANFTFTGKLTEFFYLFILIVTMVLIDNFKFHLLVLIVCLLSFYVPNYFFRHYDSDVFGYASSGVLFIIVFWLIRQLIEVNEKHERDLLNDKNTIISQKNKIEEFNKMKSEFFMNLSHDIRTPLTLLQGYTDSLLKNTGLSANYDQVLIIRQQGEEINRILNKILNLGKLENEILTLSIEKLNLTMFLDQTSSKFHPLFTQRHIDFSIQIPDHDIYINADQHLFHGAIDNLITNALKFTPNNGNVNLILEEKGQELILSVINDGQGIAEQDLSQVFNRFYQGQNNESFSKGTGIGLAFTKTIIEAHGFTIGAESTPLKSTVFSIQIPDYQIVMDSHDRIELSKSKVLTSDVKRLVIAEDNMGMQKLLMEILSSYTLHFANNGEEALSLLATDTYDLLITDYMMPIMNGDELVDKVKSLNLDIPIIVLSARVDGFARRKMLRYGVDAYLSKPFLTEELILSIERSIKMSASIKKLQKEIHIEDKRFLTNNAQKFNTELNTFIEENMVSNQFSVEQIASNFGMSKSTLNRRVKSLLGQTTKQIIMEARLQKARDILLLQPEVRDKELAAAVGIKNSSYLREQLGKRFNIEKRGQKFT